VIEPAQLVLASRLESIGYTLVAAFTVARNGVFLNRAVSV